MKVLTKKEAASVINTEWYYSWHWPESGWHEQALSDCEDRIEHVHSDLFRLIDMRDRLREIVNG